jgi:3-hydroxy acid dehydrogenase / malonic semialdehyde reductase
VIDTNLKGVFYVTKLIVSHMKARSAGVFSIINIGSIAGIEGYAGGSIYCASKFGLSGFTECLRHECVSFPNVRVAEIKPGLVQTEFSQVRHFGDKVAASETYAGLTPLAAGDIAEMAHFIASRPPHVQIGDMVVYPSCQSGARSVHRSI